MSVDSRIVDLKFNYSQFESGVASVLRGVSALAKGLQLNGASKGMADVNAAAAKTPGHLSNMAGAVTNIGQQFSAMSVVAVGALAAIGAAGIAAVGRIGSSFSTGPIVQGFQEYETKMKSIQTILANTSRHGTGLETVNAELEKLNKYADKTIYNFSEMTKNASLFTNSGMKIEDATQVIKGFSNAAAASGTGATEAAGAAFQLSQAFAVGKITLMDWRSLTNRGMGNKNMQDSLVQLAQGMGTFNSNTTLAEKVQQDFNGSLEKGWLTADVMSTYLQAMTGDMTDAELAAKGLSAEQVKSLQQQAQTALDAATKVRTFTALMETTKEAVASGWTTTFETIFGGFDEATNLFTSIGDKVSGFVNGMSDSRNAMLGVWKELGGRDVLIKGIGDAFKGVASILKPIKDAFREIFPKQTAQGLFDLTTRFADFTAKLKIGADTAEGIKRTFAGVFAVFSIAGQIIGGAISAVAKLIGLAGKGSGGFLNFTGGIGDFIVALDKMLEKSGLVTAFFDGLGAILAVPLKLLGGIGSIIAGLFTGFDIGTAEDFKGVLKDVEKTMDPLQSAAAKVSGFFQKVGQVIAKFGTAIGTALSGFGDKIAEAFAGDNFSKVLGVINTGLLGGILLLIKSFLSNDGLSINVADGLFGGAKEALGEVTNTMKAMQTQIKADVILKIAAALAVLTASLFILSTIDGKKLANALKGAAYGMGGLVTVMVVMTKAIDTLGAFKLLPLTVSLIALASALLIFSLALKVMASIDGSDMVKGLFGLGASLVIIAGAMRLMPKGMLAQAVALTVLAGALLILSVAIKSFAGISWDEMQTGFSALAGSLLILAAAMRLMPTNMVLQAVALTILAVALNAIALALKVFGSMDLRTIGTGLLAMAGALVIIAGAMNLMPKGMLLQAAALVAVGVALNIISLALQSLGGMSVGEVATSLIALAGALTILAIGLTVMTGSLGGAAALLVAAGALAILVPILVTLGLLPMSVIVGGLVALAGVFVVLGAAGILLTPLVPTLLALAGVLVLISVSLLTVAGSALLFATAFTTVVSVGAEGVRILGDILGTLISSIPKALAAFGQGIVNLAEAIGRGGAAFFKAFSTILSSILNAVIKNAPLIARAFLTMMQSLLKVVVTAAPMIAAAGLQLIVRMLSVMSANVGRIVTVAVSLITNFLNAISANLGRIIQSGVTLIISFINGVANAIRNNSSAMGAAGANLATAVVEGMARGLASGAKVLASRAASMAKGALNAAKAALGIASPSKEFEKVGKYVVEGFAKGLKGDQASVKAAYKTMNDTIISAMSAADASIKKHTDRLESLRGSNAKTVRSAQENLARLQSAKKKDAAAIAKAQRTVREATAKDTKAIKETTAALAQARAERAKLGASHFELTKRLNDEEMKLESLAIQHSKVKDEIKDQSKVLEDAIKTRDDYAKSLTDQFRNLPDVTKDTKLPKYMEELQKKVGETQAFSTAIQKLRDLGLNDTMYKELLAKGTEANPFLSQLLDGGKTAIDAVNKLGSQLDLASSKIGNSASISLYQAGVDAAQGLLNGLKSKESAIVKQMEVLATQMITALKKKLGIKSPSREFAKLGAFSADGLAQGFQQSGAVAKAAGQVGDDALEAMRRSMSGLGGLVAEGMDLSPVITPILDLSGVQRDARAVGGLFPGDSLSVSSSFSKAKSAMKGYEESRSVSSDIPPGVVPVQQTTFNQYNNSPKALSEAEIYRSTKSALSRERGKVT